MVLQPPPAGDSAMVCLVLVANGALDSQSFHPHLQSFVCFAWSCPFLYRRSGNLSVSPLRSGPATMGKLHGGPRPVLDYAVSLVVGCAGSICAPLLLSADEGIRTQSFFVDHVVRRWRGDHRKLSHADFHQVWISRRTGEHKRIGWVQLRELVAPTEYCR